MKSAKLLIVFFVLLTVLGCSFAALAGPLTAVPVDATADGTYVLMTNDYYHGLALVNNLTGQSTVITDGRNAGYYATISADQRYVCYKAFKEERSQFLQAAMIYDIASGQSIALTEWASLVGTPAVAADGTIAVTRGNDLLLMNAHRAIVDVIEIGYHVNLLSFNGDGQKIAFNNDEGQIVVLDRSQKSMKVVDGKNLYWGPKFSPKGDQLLAPTVNGYTALVDLNGEIKSFVKGQPLGWVDDQTFAYFDRTVDEKEGKVINSRLVLKNTQDQSVKEIAFDGDTTVAVKGGQVAVAREGRLELGKIKEKELKLFEKKTVKIPAEDIFKSQEKKSADSSSDIGLQSIYNGVYSIYLTGMPYIHQVYDTANNFNGHWACGATAALMAIQYYNILPTHPITVSVPSSHTSNYGWYVSNVYTKGRSFNIYGADPNGNLFAGGYGYIIQNDWADTKGRMAEYIRYHGRASSVDWSPTFAEAKTNINADHPFVILTSLTSAGHYITCRGYYKSQYSLVINDPYGNKNSGYMNYSGSLVAYDWPGYNNGYANMNTVHCFIYCQ